jgi:hypothetical protein
MFITIRFRFLNLSIRSIFGRRTSTFPPSSSSEYYSLSYSSSRCLPINKIIIELPLPLQHCGTAVQKEVG